MRKVLGFLILIVVFGLTGCDTGLTEQICIMSDASGSYEVIVRDEDGVFVEYEFVDIVVTFEELKVSNGWTVDSITVSEFEEFYELLLNSGEASGIEFTCNGN